MVPLLRRDSHLLLPSAPSTLHLNFQLDIVPLASHHLSHTYCSSIPAAFLLHFIAPFKIYPSCSLGLLSIYKHLQTHRHLYHIQAPESLVTGQGFLCIRRSPFTLTPIFLTLPQPRNVKPPIKTPLGRIRRS